MNIMRTPANLIPVSESEPEDLSTSGRKLNHQGCLVPQVIYFQPLNPILTLVLQFHVKFPKKPMKSQRQCRFLESSMFETLTWQEPISSRHTP